MQQVGAAKLKVSERTSGRSAYFGLDVDFGGRKVLVEGYVGKNTRTQLDAIRQLAENSDGLLKLEMRECKLKSLGNQADGSSRGADVNVPYVYSLTVYEDTAEGRRKVGTLEQDSKGGLQFYENGGLAAVNQHGKVLFLGLHQVKFVNGTVLGTQKDNELGDVDIDSGAIAEPIERHGKKESDALSLFHSSSTVSEDRLREIEGKVFSEYFTLTSDQITANNLLLGKHEPSVQEMQNFICVNPVLYGAVASLATDPAQNFAALYGSAPMQPAHPMHEFFPAGIIREIGEEENRRNEREWRERVVARTNNILRGKLDSSGPKTANLPHYVDGIRGPGFDSEPRVAGPQFNPRHIQKFFVPEMDGNVRFGRFGDARNRNSEKMKKQAGTLISGVLGAAARNWKDVSGRASEPQKTAGPGQKSEVRKGRNRQVEEQKPRAGEVAKERGKRPDAKPAESRHLKRRGKRGELDPLAREGRKKVETDLRKALARFIDGTAGFREQREKQSWRRKDFVYFRAGPAQKFRRETAKMSVAGKYKEKTGSKGFSVRTRPIGLTFEPLAYGYPKIRNRKPEAGKLRVRRSGQAELRARENKRLPKLGKKFAHVEHILTERNKNRFERARAAENEAGRWNEAGRAAKQERAKGTAKPAGEKAVLQPRVGTRCTNMPKRTEFRQNFRSVSPFAVKIRGAKRNALSKRERVDAIIGVSTLFSRRPRLPGRTRAA